jgi:mevalonate kinase
MIEASACAKLILFGEHAAVYGYPVIAIPLLALRAKASLIKAVEGSGLIIDAADIAERWVLRSLDEEPHSPLLLLAKRLIFLAGSVSVPDVLITISSDIPIASGLGSGAAVATALARVLVAFLRLKLSLNALNMLVYEAERFYHGNPSGIDNLVIVYERPLYFVRDFGVHFLEVSSDLVFLILDSGIPSSTRVAVSEVRVSYFSSRAGFRFPVVVSHLVDSAFSSLDSAESGQLGALMVQNHCLLQLVGVSHPVLDRLVFCLLEMGSFGSKVSGAGVGGNLVALVSVSRVSELTYVGVYAGAFGVRSSQGVK